MKSIDYNLLSNLSLTENYTKIVIISHYICDVNNELKNANVGDLKETYVKQK